jgi:hypothetical protein
MKLLLEGRGEVSPLCRTSLRHTPHSRGQAPRNAPRTSNQIQKCMLRKFICDTLLGGELGAIYWTLRKAFPRTRWTWNMLSDDLLGVITFIRACRLYCITPYVLGKSLRSRLNNLIAPNSSRLTIAKNYFLAYIFAFTRNGGYSRTLHTRSPV